MPYEMAFTKEVQYRTEDYYNECCFGGENFVELLIPLVNKHFSNIQSEQEEW